MRLVALGEVVAFEHPRQGVFGGQLDKIAGAEVAHPSRVESDGGSGAIEYLEYLLGVGLGVLANLLMVERLASNVFASRVADEASEIADEEYDLVPQILELTHFVEQYRVAEVQIWRCRVEADFDAQALTASEQLLQFGGVQDIRAAAAEEVEVAICHCWALLRLSARRRSLALNNLW